MAVHTADAVNMALMLLSSLQVWNRYFWYVHVVWLAFQNDFEILGLRGGNGRVFVHSPAAPKTIFLKRSIIHSIKFEYDIFKQSWGFLWLIWRKVTKTILNKSLFCNKWLLYTPQSKTELWGHRYNRSTRSPLSVTSSISAADRAELQEATGPWTKGQTATTRMVQLKVELPSPQKNTSEWPSDEAKKHFFRGPENARN